MAFLAPTSDSKVRSMKSSRACTSTWSQTSSGARFSSMRRRLKVNSVFEAEGKPTSISLKPHFTRVWKSSSFWPTFIGMARAWLPSRRSTLHQTGAWVRTRLGHWRSGKWTGGNGRYLVDGFFEHGSFDLFVSAVRQSGKQKPHRRVRQWGSVNSREQLEPDRRAASSSAFDSSRFRFIFTGPK